MDHHLRTCATDANLLVHGDNNHLIFFVISPSSDLDLFQPPTTKIVNTITSLFRSEGHWIWHPNGDQIRSEVKRLRFGGQICDSKVKGLKSGGHSSASSLFCH
ncbi:Uncharacterized protein Fot_15646 [Forsythia ovata]|uniref:Uncharacterized protein n=1 Tax=Forsythia ovata TaxID=205694 RepID=A0ABD1WC53_9LAMI